MWRNVPTSFSFCVGATKGIVLALGGLAALASGCAGRPSYTILGIEMAVTDQRAKDHKRVSIEDALERLYHSGPSAVPELSLALENDQKHHRSLAGHALRRMTRYWRWREAYDFMIGRMRMGPRPGEAHELLYAMAHDGIASHREVALLVAPYLDDHAVVRVVALNSPENRVEMRACDYAAHIIRVIAGEDVGESYSRQSDEDISKAREWVAKQATSR